MSKENLKKQIERSIRAWQSEERYGEIAVDNGNIEAFLQDIFVEINREFDEEPTNALEILDGEILSEIMNYEAVFLKSSEDLEQKSAEYWGMLILAHKLKVLEWDRVIGLFGEFTSKAMKLR